MLSIPPPITVAAPLYWRRGFPGGDAGQARAARRFVACLLADRPYLDDAVLVADELVANALRHTRSGEYGGCFTVEVLSTGDGMAVAVTDQGGTGEPVVRCAADTDQSGRGLHIVSATAASWGWYGNARGRTVSALFTPGYPHPAPILT